ncbi:MAG: hypothetical protein R2733_05095 [Acidimicrobiales bacterium]
MSTETLLESTTDAATSQLGEGVAPPVDAKALERKGRRWLIWSFVFCPCHLPLSMAVLASIFGSSAFGALVSRNTLGTGLVLGAIYAVGVGIGFRYLRQATKGYDCSGDTCTLE